jgi:hypothetical protein
VTVDARAASLPTAIVSVETDGPSALTITGLRPGTVVQTPGAAVTVGADGAVTLDIPSGASALAWSRG